ncbi:hypothetical protein FCULG_00012637 [Fusarium culmorum]|uniref:C2H2-type domain-containing protein n=1 Tax=Fusarium culmorum TaxID=5516 RepID=A0A2T4GG75_FUSCU|nr:hypothetical protein FCULG_00012637 [Fusarium culmorum]
MDSYTSRFRLGQNFANKRSCSICGHVFTRTEHLTRHERSRKSAISFKILLVSCFHALPAEWLTVGPLDRGEKPFQCSLCGFASCRKDLLKRHISRHHSGIESTIVATDTSEASGGHHDEGGSSKETNQFSLDSIFEWGSDMPDFGSLNSLGPLIPNDLSSIIR